MPGSSTSKPTGLGAVERWRSDRLARAMGYAVVALAWLIFALDEGGLAIVVTVIFAACAALELLAWRHGGRWKTPTSTEPPELSPDQRDRVATLVGLGDDVAAVRLVRQETGAGLLAAKRAVDGVTAGIV